MTLIHRNQKYAFIRFARIDNWMYVMDVCISIISTTGERMSSTWMKEQYLGLVKVPSVETNTGWEQYLDVGTVPGCSASTWL